MSSPLPFFTYEDLFHSRITKKEIIPGEWRVEVAPTLPNENGVSAKFSVNGNVDATCELTCEVPNTPFSVQTSISAVERPKRSCGCDNICLAKMGEAVDRFTPALIYKRGYHAVTAKFASGHVDYEFAHPAFFGTASVHATAGLATLASLSARLQPNLFGGFYMNYDPFRSGLRNYTFSLLARNVRQAKNADVLVSLDATRGLLVGFSAAVKDNLHATVLVRPLMARQTLVAGLEARSPCGAQILARVDVGQQLFGVTLSKIMRSTWRVSVGWSISNAHNTITPKLGVAFTKDM